MLSSHITQSKFLDLVYDIPGITTADKNKEKVVQCFCNVQ